MTNNQLFSPETDEAKRLNADTRQRYDLVLGQQQDPEFLRSHKLPQVSPTYRGPKIATHSAGSKHENAFVITNNEHSKTTNNGYKRGNAGNFFCH